MSIFIVGLIPWFALLIAKTKRSLHMAQLNYYDESRKFLSWMIKNYVKIFIEVDLYIIIFVFLAMFVSPWAISLMFAIFYLVIDFLYYKRIKKEDVIQPLVSTPRVRRLVTTTLVLYFIPIAFMLWNYTPDRNGLYYSYLGILLYLNFFVVYLAIYVNYPIEKLVNKYYRRKAEHKMADMKNLKVVGITGSYGKTSSKNILNEILSIKYSTLPTPKSFNTPYGLMITINNHLDKFDEIFIAEMGAFRKGDIQELCDFVHPKYGILTRIGIAHLESFGSQENVQQGKFELIESLPKDGVGILNADDPLQVSYPLKNNCKIIWIGIDNKEADVRATYVKSSSRGTTFQVTINGDKHKYKFETKLLGRANVYNILSSIALGLELGLTMDQMIQAVKAVKPVKSRLELVIQGGINYIHDDYNANPVGAQMALEVLNDMDGKKVVVTPGIVDLGTASKEVNQEFGKQIAAVADEVILVQNPMVKYIKNGLQEAGYKDDKIHVIQDVKKAYNMVYKQKETEEVYVLFENDLPDNFK